MNGLEKGYMFRIKFQTPENERITMPGNNEIKAKLFDKLDITLKDVSTEDHKNGIYILKGGAFDSKEEAERFALKIRDSILSYCAANGKGVSFNSFGFKLFITDAGKEWVKSLFGFVGSEIYEDRFGITIYESDKDVKFVSSNPSLVVGHPADNFIHGIENRIKLPKEFNDKELLTLEIYTSSSFEKTNNSKFLQLMMGIESMLDLEESDKEIQDMLNYFISYINNSRMEPGKKQYLTSSIGNLKKESITKAGIRISNKYLSGKQYHGKNPGDFYKYCYDLRSKLLHECKNSPEIDDVLGDFVTFVGDLIKAKILT
jgi:hypothetical protein